MRTKHKDINEIKRNICGLKKNFEKMPTSNSEPQIRLLVIRFSSFGDIVQAAAVPAAFKKTFSIAEIDWLVRDDFGDLLSHHQHLNKVIRFDGRQSPWQLFRMAWRLATTGGYTHVYDAHCNIRSKLVMLVFRMQFFSPITPRTRLLTRSKNRIRRWLFFKFRARSLPRPYRGAQSFLWPLEKWQISSSMPSGQQFWSRATVPSDIVDSLSRLSKPCLALAPSAAWEMKRWPVEHWQKLIRLLPDFSFALLGGPQDQFIANITGTAPERCLNFAGRLSLQESVALLQLQLIDLVVANDTGILHVADQMEIPTIALIGPTAFGYPSHVSSHTMEVDLACKPCSKDGRGKCHNSVYQRCLVELSPESVAQMVGEILASRKPNV
jgi:heptosyltransferase-2